ncbi:interleukin-31 receptor subunit alpha-like protein [Lates japonicus]|uniref:Interleukin-31 receptor subunit alpha-like protein n=1 Tax=Lates japonicus TaxID=270547 RepID=A0AAD3M8S4_LATJO|nr:interleukin-31 receptor subunit alpha-like protein [Lates japonicus]
MDPFPVTFILVVILSSPICKGRKVNTCNVTPKDQYIEVGSDAQVVCQTSCVRGKIFWTLNNRPINERLSNATNSSHTVLSLKNFTHHSATLQCHSAETQQVLGGTTIRTYSKPSKISCRFYYVSQSEGLPDRLMCSWEHQINSSLEVNYTVDVCQAAKCTPYEIKRTSIDIDAVKMYTNKNISITVRAKTAAWEVSSSHVEFDYYDILKIIPRKVNIDVLSDHLLVKWKRPNAQGDYRCQVKYSKVVSDGTSEEGLKEISNITANITVESCSTYKITVRCALNNAPWSDWSQEKTVLTKLNKSDIKLRLWRKIAEKEKNGVRKVCAMWMEIPATCQDTFNYSIKQIPYKEHMTGVNYTDTSCSKSNCVVDVNQDAHRINLTVLHNETPLAEDSVYIPAIGESLPQVTELQTATAEGVILVSWKAPVQPVRGYMIDWTHNGNQYYWKESKYTNTTLSDLFDKKPYNITVTPLFDDKTGHGTQALQICSRVGDPGNVTIVDVRPYDKSAYVSWSTKSQEECSGAVINYTILCSTQGSPVLNVTVDRSKQDILLQDLKPDTQYSVYVTATALTGTTKSIERLFKTKRFDPRLITALGVSGTIIIILVLSLGLCCAVQWKKFREKPLPNPGLSSVVLWPSPGHQERTLPFQAFNNPSESLCDMVYPEETQRMPSPPLATSRSGNPASDQTEEYTDPALVLTPDVQNEKPTELIETQLSSPGESTALLSSGNGPISPYRSQSSVETPASRASKLCQRVPVKQQEKTAPMTVYVTLNMFEQGQGR